jgi:hypothetical protein
MLSPLRLADAQSPEHAVAEAAIEPLIAREESVFISRRLHARMIAQVPPALGKH